MAADNKDNKEAQKAVLAAVQGEVVLKKRGSASANESTSLSHAKVQVELKKKPDLDHVEGPKPGLTDAQKQAFLEEKKAKEQAKQ